VRQFHDSRHFKSVADRRVASFRRARISALFFFAAASAHSAEPTSTPAARSLAVSIQRATLENGLRVVLNVDHSSPNVAVSVTYDVGSRNEEPGKSGFAHLFEHVMFQGSAHVKKGEHFTLITARGGTLNGTTSTDRTNYFETLPASELPLSLWLEADRMKSLAVTEPNVENQRAVVQEEYRMRVSNQVYSGGFIKLRSLVFQNYFPYEHDTIGSMQDLDQAKFEWIATFHDAYYAPDNAVLTVAGDFDPDEAMRLIHEDFDDAVRRKSVPAYVPPALAEQTAPRHADVTDTNANTPALYQGWAIPPSRTPEHYALELAASILGQGESSRLYQKLVRKDGKAQSTSVWTEGQRGPDMFALRVVLSPHAKLPDVQRDVDAEIDAFAKSGPTQVEVDRAKTRVSADFLFGLESNQERAIELGEYETYWGDARLLSTELEHYRAVTPGQIKAAVRSYLVKARRSTVHVLPPGPEADKILSGKAPEGSLCGGP
jgi:predicted Zn-dependent peptidase